MKLEHSRVETALKTDHDWWWYSYSGAQETSATARVVVSGC